MLSIQDILNERIKQFNENPEQALKTKSKEYNKKWNEAVNFFVERINKDMKKEKRPLFTFIVIRQKLIALREIDDLRWFYRECIKYSNTYQKTLLNGKPIRNTFSRCFFGALRIK